MESGELHFHFINTRPGSLNYVIHPYSVALTGPAGE